MELSLENLLNEVNKIPGGLAKNKTLDDIVAKHGVEKNELEKQLEKGIKVEVEHTTDEAIAKEIAMDHLFEDPKYYDKLNKLEEGTCGYNADVKTGKEFKTPGGMKLKKDPYGLDAFARELVKEFNDELNEVGELKVPPYEYSKPTHDDLELEDGILFGTVAYNFTTQDGNFYDVVFEYDYDNELEKNILKIDFTSDGSYEMTNSNEPYKIMSTVFSMIIKELSRDIVKDNLDLILYMPAETKTKNGEDARLKGIEQRNKLYKAFFKKNIPYIKVEEVPNETRFYLKEEIAASEATTNKGALQTIIDNKRNLGFFVLGGSQYTPAEAKDFWNSISKYSLKSLRVPSHPHNAYIIYRPGSEKEASELKSIAEKYEGYLSYRATKEDTRRIGELLGYKKEDVDKYVDERYPNESLNEAVRCKAIFNTPQNDLIPYIKTLTQYMDDNIDIRPLPKVKFVDDEANASKILGNTAYYDPQNCAITLYITDRHPKDILRSFAHEMIHHMQNMQGRLNNIGTQNINQDDNLKGLEKEAYELGNILLRSWENSQDQINEAIIRPTNTGVGVMPLTTREKEWIEDKLYDFSQTKNPPTDPDSPVEYAFITRDIVEDDIDWGLSTPEDLELFNSIHRKLKYKIYTLNLGFDPKINKYPQEYDLRDSVVRADSDNGMPELTVTWSDRQDSVDSTFGAFDKDTGEYLKYSDLDNIGKVDEAKIQPKSIGVGKMGKKLKVTFTLDPDIFRYNKNIKSINDIEPNTHIGGLLSSKDLPDLYADLHKTETSNVVVSILAANSNNTELGQWKQKLDSMDIMYGHENQYMIRDIPVEKYLFFDLNSSKLTTEARILPTKTGIGKKINIEFHPDESDVKSIKDIYNKLQNTPRLDTTSSPAVRGKISTKDFENFPSIFVDIYFNKQNELTIDLESGSSSPESYDMWEEKLQKLRIPFKADKPFIDDINVDKYFKMTVNPK
jgi:hypothetical protein